MSDPAIRLRRLVRGESAPVLDVFRGLSERSRRLRFHGPKPRLGDAELEQLVDLGRSGREAVAAVDVATGRTVGIGRLARGSDDAEAEVAFAVVDAWQGRGVGRALLGELLRLARCEGIERFRVTVSASNEAALALVRRAGSVVSARLEDGTYDLVVALR